MKTNSDFDLFLFVAEANEINKEIFNKAVKNGACSTATTCYTD